MQNKTIVHRTLPAIIANILREEIISGKLSVGYQLKQEELSNRFEVSFSVLREALKSLESEGLVNIYPNKGAVVSQLSPDEVVEIFDIRVFLETGALELSIPKLTQQDLADAESLLLLTDNDRYSIVNWKFHSALYQRSDRPKLLDMINSLYYNVERYMRMYLYTMHHHDRSQKEHWMLLDACKKKDIKKAQVILKKHMLTASNQLVEYIKTNN